MARSATPKILVTFSLLLTTNSIGYVALSGAVIELPNDINRERSRNTLT